MRASERQDLFWKIVHRLRADKHISEDEASLLYSVGERIWDDAVHIASPWDDRISLCGNWDRNLVALDAPRPDGWEGCWSCLRAADTLDATHPQTDRLAAMREHQWPMERALRVAERFLYALPKGMRKDKRRKEVLRLVAYAVRGQKAP